MATAEINLGDMGGGGNVATGTFSITSQDASKQITIDTGLGASIKHLVIIGISSIFPSPDGGLPTALAWSKDAPTSYFAGGFSSNASYTLTIGGTRYVAVALGIVSHDGSGKFVVDASATIANSQGDYIWYAE